MNARARSIVTWCAAAIAVASFAWLTRTRGHHQDVAMFRGWFESLATSPRDVYVDRATDVNYGAVGLLVSTLAGWFVPDNAPAAAFHATHKVLLALWALGCAWCVRSLVARLLPSEAGRRERADAIALLALAWPCISLGGLYFGQIDIVALVFVLLAFVSLHDALASEPGPRRRIALGTLGAFTAIAILTKPLVLFSLPALGLAALVTLSDTHARAGSKTMRGDLVVLVATTGALLALPDLFFRTPRENLFHLWHVYRWAGPPHGEMIGNGAGMWAFLGWAPDARSRDILAFGVSPRVIGLVCFFAALAGHTVEFARDVRRERTPRDVTAHALRHAGMLQLAMSLFLSGTHERYAFLAWVPLLVALLVNPASLDPSRMATVALVLAGTFQGLFVVSTIEWNAFEHAQIFRSTRLAAALTFVAYGSIVAARLFARRRPRPAPE